MLNPPAFIPRCSGGLSFLGTSSLVLAVVLATAPLVRGASAAVSENHPTSANPPGFVVVPLGRGQFNRLCVAATVQGVKGLMIVDSGASHSTLNEAKYRFLLPTSDRKLPSGIPAYVRVNGSREPMAVTRDYRVHDVDLGGIPLVLMPEREFYDGFHADRQYDGLLGEDLLRRFHAVLDCGRLAIYFNTDRTKPLNLGPALTRAGWTRIPMTNLQNDFLVPCKINGHHFRMVVDTGAPFTTMDRRQLLNVGISARDTRLGGGIIGRRPQEMGYVRLPQAGIGDYPVTGFSVFADPDSSGFFQDQKNDTASGKVLGLLGGDFLAANNAIIDVGGGSLYLKRSSASR